MTFKNIFKIFLILLLVATVSCSDKDESTDLEQLSMRGGLDVDLDSNDILDAAYGGTNVDSSAWTGFPYVTAGVWAELTAIDPDLLDGDTTDNDLVDNAIIQGFQAVASPSMGLRDSDAAGADPADEFTTALEGGFSTTTEDAEVSDSALTVMGVSVAGTKYTYSFFDGSDAKWYMGALAAYTNANPSVAPLDLANFESLVWDFDYGADTVGVSSPVSGTTSLDFIGITLKDDGVNLLTAAPNTIDSDQYVDGSIDNAHLADDAVDSDEIASGAVDLDHMSANSVDSDQYVDGSIDNEHLADGAVDTQELAADAVEGSKIADDQIDSEHYAAGSIDNEHLAAHAVQIDCALTTADDTYSGVPFTGLTAGSAIAQWDFVTIHDDGKWDPATNATEDEVGFGFAVYEDGGGWPAADTDGIYVLTQGCIRNDGWTWTDQGVLLYMSTGGDLTETAPTTDNYTHQPVAIVIKSEAGGDDEDVIMFPVPAWAKVDNP
jgi:hypothetical protein